MANEDILKTLRNAVGQSLEQAQAESKIPPETQAILSQLYLTRKGNGEVALDVSALQRMKAAENQWASREQNQQDRLVNPTRLPSLLPGLQGLSSNQYLAYVQRPLERDGSNGPFLEAACLRVAEQYQDKDLAQDRNKLFGHFQRYVAKLVIDSVLSKEHNTTDQDELDKLRETTPPQKQFELASKALGVPTGEVMNRLYKCAVALTLIERIKTKAVKVRKAQPSFEKAMKKFANSESGPAVKRRIKDLFMGYQTELDNMAKEYAQLSKQLSPIVAKLSKGNFQQTIKELHLVAARLDAIASRWMIIITEANSHDVRSTVERIQGMHKIYTE